MAGPFSLITGGLLGEQNPADEMGNWSDEQQKRNRAALGLDANGNPLPPSPPGAGAPQGAPAQGGGAQGALQAQASSTLPPNQEPNATKTPVSLGHTMMNLAQYEQREQGFNQAMGTGFAAFAQPRDRQMVSQMFNTTPLDASKLAGQSMSLASQQQGQDRANAVSRMINDPNLGPQIARAYGMDWAGLKAGALADPGLVARIAETWGTADPKVRAATQVGAGALGGPGGPGGAPGPIRDVGKQIVSEVGGQPEMTSAQTDWDERHPNTPTPWHRNDVESFKQYTANQQELNKTVAEARNMHGSNIDTVTELQNRVAALGGGTTTASQGLKEIVNSSRPYKEMAQYLLDHPGETPAMAIKAVPRFAHVTLSDNAMAAISELQQLKGQQYSSALKSLHMSRPAATEVESVNKGLSQLSNLDSLSPDTYQDQAINPMVEDLKTVRGGSYGASQDFKNLPKDLRTYVNPEYLKGGNRNLEDSGSEDWSESTKMSPEEQTAASNKIGTPHDEPEKKGKVWTRAEVNALVRQHGKRPSGF